MFGDRYSDRNLDRQQPMSAGSNGESSLHSFRIDYYEFLATATDLRFQPQLSNSSLLPKLQLFLDESVQH